ncbi:hypothetical protein GCM10022237_21230 [Nocardioides ginsengisoli]|uniref:DNRLRE domain-containing protein n=1 Tax=Nocardioides ginsengisoli TaxID=363868 RepID=A0ABW3W2D7_9ACTN
MADVRFKRAVLAASSALVAASLQLPAGAHAAAAAAAEPPAPNPDGTTTVVLTATGDTYVQSGLSQPNRSAATELVVGSSNNGLTKTRSLLSFDLGSIDLTSSTVVSAELQLSNFVTGSCAGSAIRLSRVTAAWKPATVKWSTQPATVATGSTTNTTANGAKACAAEGPAKWDATAIVQAWAAGAANNGVQIRPDAESKATGYRKYRSLENGDPAKAATLTVTINQPPSTPTKLTASPGANGYARTTTPTLSAVVSDPGGGQVAGFFQISHGNDIVWSGTSALVASGETASIDVPAGKLTEGTPYILSAWSQDSQGARSTSPTANWLVVDATAPTVAVTSAKFTNNVWTKTVPASDTLTLTGTPDTKWFAVSADGKAFLVNADASGNGTLAYAPVAGWHDIVVIAGDVAGNMSEPATISYGVGDRPVFSLPAANSYGRTSFAVNVSGPPTASTGVLYWRVAGETQWRVATQLVTADGKPWTGALTSTSGRTTTGALTWNATQENYNGGKLAEPAVLQIRTCFDYADPKVACTDLRNLGLGEKQQP